MKINNSIKGLDQENFGDTDSVEATIGLENIAIAIGLVSQNIYSNIISTIIRELTSNGYDANIEGNSEFPVIIRFDYKEEDSTYWLHIIDQGVGMSKEFIYKKYMSWFDSTKRESNDMIGGFGIGSKSPLGYSNEYYLTTYFDNIRYEYIISKGSRLPVCDLLVEEDDEYGKGTTVSLEIKEIDFYKFVKEAINTLTFFKHVFIDLTESLVKRISSEKYSSISNPILKSLNDLLLKDHINVFNNREIFIYKNLFKISKYSFNNDENNYAIFGSNIEQRLDGISTYVNFINLSTNDKSLVDQNDYINNTFYDKVFIYDGGYVYDNDNGVTLNILLNQVLYPINYDTIYNYLLNNNLYDRIVEELSNDELFINNYVNKYKVEDLSNYSDQSIIEEILLPKSLYSTRASFFNSLSKNNISLFFNIGELAVTLSRENIEYNEHSLLNIHSKICRILIDVYENIKDFHNQLVNNNYQTFLSFLIKFKAYNKKRQYNNRFINVVYKDSIGNYISVLSFPNIFFKQDDYTYLLDFENKPDNFDSYLLTLEHKVFDAKNYPVLYINDYIAKSDLAKIFNEKNKKYYIESEEIEVESVNFTQTIDNKTVELSTERTKVEYIDLSNHINKYNRDHLKLPFVHHASFKTLSQYRKLLIEFTKIIHLLNYNNFKDIIYNTNNEGENINVLIKEWSTRYWSIARYNYNKSGKLYRLNEQFSCSDEVLDSFKKAKQLLNVVKGIEKDIYKPINNFIPVEYLKHKLIEDNKEAAIRKYKDKINEELLREANKLRNKERREADKIDLSFSLTHMENGLFTIKSSEIENLEEPYYLVNYEFEDMNGNTKSDKSRHNTRMLLLLDKIISHYHKDSEIKIDKIINNHFKSVTKISNKLSEYLNKNENDYFYIIDPKQQVKILFNILVTNNLLNIFLANYLNYVVSYNRFNSVPYITIIGNRESILDKYNRLLEAFNSYLINNNITDTATVDLSNLDTITSYFKFLERFSSFYSEKYHQVKLLYDNHNIFANITSAYSNYDIIDVYTEEFIYYLESKPINDDLNKELLKFSVVEDYNILKENKVLDSAIIDMKSNYKYLLFDFHTDIINNDDLFVRGELYINYPKIYNREITKILKELGLLYTNQLDDNTYNIHLELVSPEPSEEIIETEETEEVFNEQINEERMITRLNEIHNSINLEDNVEIRN